MKGQGAVAQRLATETSSPPLGAVGAARFWWHLPDLLGSNLRFLAWCAPFGLLALLGLPALALAVAPVTLGPGVIGLVTAAARVARGEPRGSEATDPRLRRRFWTGSVLATALFFAWHAQLVALRALVAHDGAPAAVGLWAAQVTVLVLGALVGVHAIPLVGLHGQRALEAIRNGFVLAVRHPGPTVATLGAVAGTGLLTWSLAGAPLIIVPAALALLAVTRTQRLVDGGGSTS
jgi:hypothetical protein